MAALSVDKEILGKTTGTPSLAPSRPNSERRRPVASPPAAPGERLQYRAPGVAQPQTLRHLVVGLAGGVVPRFSQQMVPCLFIHQIQTGVTSRYDQRDRGVRDGLRFRTLHVGGPDVTFQMVDG